MFFEASSWLTGGIASDCFASDGSALADEFLPLAAIDGARDRTFVRFGTVACGGESGNDQAWSPGACEVSDEEIVGWFWAGGLLVVTAAVAEGSIETGPVFDARESLAIGKDNC